MAITSLTLFLALCLSFSSGYGFQLSNTLGDHMVLQRAPASSIVWGFGTPGSTVTTTFKGQAMKATTGSDGVWRQSLPATPATATGTTISFASSEGQSASLQDVIFGDVILCSGQSNMQYTPHSMAGMNNLTAELAAADAYANDIRFFTVGQNTACPNSSTAPCTQLPEIPAVPTGGPCGRGRSCRSNWTLASSAALGGAAWNTFSAICWLTGRDIYDGLGGEVPLGLISSNWGGTPVQSWQPAASVQDCNGGKPAPGGNLYNSMIAPFTVGPMKLTGATWYQGESNVGAASYYACGFPSMIKRWREAFADDKLWFGFVQIAGYAYSHPYDGHRPETQHSLAAGDLRQSQLAALALPNVGLTTAIDTGDWTNIHPPDKQFPSQRLARQALAQIYGRKDINAEFPLYAGSAANVDGANVVVTVQIRAGGAGGAAVKLTTDAPVAATQTSTLGKGVSVPRNQCVTYGFASSTFPQDCGYPAIIGAYANGTAASLNATATIAGSTIVLTAAIPAGSGFKATASSYGRASWPRTVFFSADNALPVIPWYADFATTDPATPPKAAGGWAESSSPGIAEQLRERVAEASAAAAAQVAAAQQQ